MCRLSRVRKDRDVSRSMLYLTTTVRLQMLYRVRADIGGYTTKVLQGLSVCLQPLGYCAKENNPALLMSAWNWLLSLKAKAQLSEACPNGGRPLGFRSARKSNTNWFTVRSSQREPAKP